MPRERCQLHASSVSPYFWLLHRGSVFRALREVDGIASRMEAERQENKDRCMENKPVLTQRRTGFTVTKG